MSSRKRTQDDEIPTSKSLLLDLEADNVEILAPVHVPDEATVSAAVKKLVPKASSQATTQASLSSSSITSSSSPSMSQVDNSEKIAPGSITNTEFVLQLILSRSEAQYLVNDSQVENYRSTFGVTNVLVSETPSGVLETLVQVIGLKLELVLHCTLLMSFIVAAKLNNFVGARKFTLKLSNYTINFLYGGKDHGSQLRHLGHKSRLKGFDYSSSYLAGSLVSSVRIRGDFHAMFDFLYQLMKIHVEPQYKILQLPITGAFGIPTLMQRQAVNQDIHVLDG